MSKKDNDMKSKGEKIKKLSGRPVKTKTKSITKNKVQANEGKLVEAARKIETGVKIVSEMTTDVVEKVSDQTTEFTEKVYDKFKKSVHDAYDVGSKSLSDMRKKTGKYIQRYEDTFDIKNLKNDRDKKVYELGTHVFNLYKSKPRNLTDLVANDMSQKLLKEIELLVKDIVKLGRRVKRKI